MAATKLSVSSRAAGLLLRDDAMVELNTLPPPDGMPNIPPGVVGESGEGNSLRKLLKLCKTISEEVQEANVREKWKEISIYIYKKLVRTRSSKVTEW